MTTKKEVEEYLFNIETINYRLQEVDSVCFQIGGISTKEVEKTVKYGKRKKLFNFRIKNDFRGATVRKA